MENPIKFESLHSDRDELAVWTHPSSPDFEFWMVRNPSVPQLNILSADELFVDGVLLPLDLVASKDTVSVQENEVDGSIGPELTSSSSNPLPSTAVGTGSRRWKDMFKVAIRESEEKVESSKMIKKRERRSGSGGHGGASATSAELNINIWPFSRSRSAGNSGAHNSSRTKISSTRKVSSAPCSRSNSGGESKSRKCLKTFEILGQQKLSQLILFQIKRRTVCTSLEVAKYYGESECLLGKVLMLAYDLPNGAILFLYEVDSISYCS